jgi:CBS domain-containing protein
MDTTPERAGSIKVSDVMTKDVIALDVNDTLDVIAGLFEKYDYNGMPVVDSEHVLKGVISKHDMILQSSQVHLPTMLKLMDQIAREKGDNRALEAHFGSLRNIKATSIMSVDGVSIQQDVPLEEAAKVFADYPNISTLCVVDAQKKLVGIVSHTDVIKLFNEVYLNRIIQGKTGVDAHVFKQFPTKSESDVEKAFADVQNEFLLVQKSRPLLWKYVSIGMFAAGLLVATALIIRFVQNRP